jgi:hypothetical protein
MIRKLAALALLSVATVPAFAAPLDPSDGQPGGAFWGNSQAITSLTASGERFVATAQVAGPYDYLDRFNP